MKSFACATIFATTMVALGCGKTSSVSRVDASGAKVTFAVDVAPARQLDMVFMVGKGACCAKAEKMKARFSTLVAQLKDPTSGALPDLRIAIIDSDLGTGGQYATGPCGPNESNGNSLWGDRGKFQMRGAASCGVTSDALWLEYSQGAPVNYSGTRDINDVFSCLVTNLNTGGCGVEQQLQAFEFALVTPNIGNEEQRKMLRPYAQLALVFISDQDDCSASPNVGMFGDKVELYGESASLRCATRGHECNGVNLTSSPPGYPTSASFSAPFASCKARMDACPNASDGTASDVVDTSGTTDCSPLKSVKHIAAEIRALKQLPDQKLVVAGIFGWPRLGADGTPDIASATYRIDLVPNPDSADTAHPQVFDYYPTCYDPAYLPSSDGFDAAAWGMGVQGGLRLAAFVDEFGKSGMKFSICESDFSNTMTAIGKTLAQRLRSSCLPATVALSGCTARLLVPDGAGGYVAQAGIVPSCAASPTASPCYTLVSDVAACAADEVNVVVSPVSAVTTSTVLQLDCK